MPPKGNKGTPLPQMVSERQIEIVQVEQGSDQSNEALNVHDTLGRLEAQLQRQELLNSHFTSQIAANSTQIQKLNEEIRSSLQLISQELKVLRLARSSKKADDLPATGDLWTPASHALNSSPGIFSSASKNGIGSTRPCLDETDLNSAFMIVKMVDECKMLVDMTDKGSKLIVANPYDLENGEILVNETAVRFSENVSIFSKLSKDNHDRTIVYWTDQVLDEMHYRYLMVESLMLDGTTIFFVFDPGGDTFAVDLPCFSTVYR